MKKGTEVRSLIHEGVTAILLEDSDLYHSSAGYRTYETAEVRAKNMGGEWYCPFFLLEFEGEKYVEVI